MKRIFHVSYQGEFKLLHEFFDGFMEKALDNNYWKTKKMVLRIEERRK